MSYWLASREDSLRHDWVKRFDPRFWTVNFPRPMMAAVTTTAADSLRVDLASYRADDLAGLIWESEDRHDHPLLAYETSRDFRGLTLRFRWRAEGSVKALDAVHGPTLTIEGRDEAGQPRAWYVRLWNYAVGTPNDAVITLDFDALDGGFMLPDEAQRVWAGDIDRLFISLVSHAYSQASEPLPTPLEGRVHLDGIACDGGGSTLTIGDAFVPAHTLRLASGYDDSYHLTPARVLRNAVQLGYSNWINHYVGMSHFFRLGWDGERFIVQADEPLINSACLAWHRDFLARASELGFQFIWSLSYELFDAHAPEGWKQRDYSGAPALTGWEPPSTLLSPANREAMAYLQAVTRAFVGIAKEADRPVHFQVGEPWWWVGPNGRPCLYDEATTAAYWEETGRALPPPLTHVGETPSREQGEYLDWAGSVLGRSTLALRDAARTEAPAAKSYLLFYSPQVLNRSRATLARFNLPHEWERPAFDVLQLEDYDFVITDDQGGQQRAIVEVEARLGYPRREQHYFAGFVLNPSDRYQWSLIDAAAEAGRSRGVAEVFVWAFPQVARDGFTHFENGADMGVESFHDVVFPLALGLEASGGPSFLTQVVTTASGHEQRNSNWADARLRYDAGLGVRSEDDLRRLLGFFRARRGQACAFRFRDPLDHSSADMVGPPSPLDQLIGIADGLQTSFLLMKRYDAAAPERRITRPEPASVRVAVSGVERTHGWQLGEGGRVLFDEPPPAGANITAGFRFDVPVRFAGDTLDISLASFRAGEVPSVHLVEVREE